MANVITQSGTIASVPQGGTYAFDPAPVDGTTVLIGLNKIGFGSTGTYYPVGQGTPLPVQLYGGGTVAGTVQVHGTAQVIGTVQTHGTSQALGTVQPLAGSVHVANTISGTVQTHGTSQIIGTVQPTPGSVHLASRLPGTVDVGTIAGTVQVLGTAVVGGNIAHDAVDAGNPLKIGGKVSTATPTPIANGDRTDAYFDEYGRLVVSDRDVEIGLTIGGTGLRDRLMAQRYTVLADSLADGLAGFWTSTTADGGTTTSSGGEGLIQTSTGSGGSAQLTSTIVPYFPGQVGWFNSAVRFNNTGTANNTRRIGVYTVSGTTPQDGFYYELSGTTLNAVIVKAGVATATASTSWSRVSEAPFTLDTSYHSFEIRYTANTVWFYIDNVLRHRVSGTTASITATLNFPITIHSINTSGATNNLIAVRNVGIGRFGSPIQPVAETGLSAVVAAAVGGATPHDSVDSGNPIKFGGQAQSSAPAAVAAGDRVNAWFDLNGRLQVRGTIDSFGGTLGGGTVQVHGTVPVGTVAGTVSVLGTVRTLPPVVVGESFFGTVFTAAVTNGTLVPAPGQGTYVRVYDLVVNGSAAGSAFLELGDGTPFGHVFLATNGGYVFNSARGVRTRGTNVDVFFNASAGTWGVTVAYALET